MLRFKVFTLTFFALIFMSIQTFADTLTYDRAIALLGVPEGSSPEAVTKAYRKLAMRLHPDRVGNNSKEEDFKTMKQAYEFLVEINFKKENDLGQGPGRSWQHESTNPERENYKYQTQEYEINRQKAAEEAQKGYTIDIDATLGMHGHFFYGARDILNMLELRMEQKNISPDLAFLVYTQTVLKYGMDEIIKLYMLSSELKVIQELVFKTTGEMPITRAVDKLVDSHLQKLKNVTKGDAEIKSVIASLSEYFGIIKLASDETKSKLAAALKAHQFDPRDEFLGRIDWKPVLKPDPDIAVRVRSAKPTRLGAPSCILLF